MFSTVDVTPRLSPTGARFAIPGGPRAATTGTDIFLSGTLSGAASGWPVGWIDDGHLLVNRYTGSGNAAGFAGANITDPTGVILTTPALDELLELQPVGANLVYAARRNTIFDTVSGDPVWDSLAPHASDMPLGAVVGNDVWFVSGSTIRVEPR